MNQNDKSRAQAVWDRIKDLKSPDGISNEQVEEELRFFAQFANSNVPAADKEYVLRIMIKWTLLYGKQVAELVKDGKFEND